MCSWGCHLGVSMSGCPCAPVAVVLPHTCREPLKHVPSERRSASRLRAKAAPERAGWPSQSLPFALPGAELDLQLPFHQAMLYGQARIFWATQPPRATTLPATTHLLALRSPACSLVDWGRAWQQMAVDWAWGCRHENEQLGTDHKNVPGSPQIGALPSSDDLSTFNNFRFFGNTLKFWGWFQRTAAWFGFAEIVSVLLTCFSQLRERDLIPLFCNFEKTYCLFSFESTCKNNSADFGMRWIELDPNLCEQKGACGCLDLYCNVYLDLLRNSYASKSV